MNPLDSQNVLSTWSEVLAASFQDLWSGVIAFVPNLVISLIIFLAGWAVGSILGNWVEKIIKSLKLDTFLESVGIDEVIQKAGFRLDGGKFIGWLVKWFVIVAFLLAALDAVGLTTVNDFLRTVVLGYIPNVIVAALMLIVAAPIAETLKKLVAGSAKAAEIAPSAAATLGTITRWAVWIFAFIAALLQLGIAREFLLTIFTGFIAMVALAGGLAFGLGGRDAAASYIEKVRHEMSGK